MTGLVCADCELPLNGPALSLNACTKLVCRDGCKLICCGCGADLLRTLYEIDRRQGELYGKTKEWYNSGGEAIPDWPLYAAMWFVPITLICDGYFEIMDRDRVAEKGRFGDSELATADQAEATVRRHSAVQCGVCDVVLGQEDDERMKLARSFF